MYRRSHWFDRRYQRAVTSIHGVSVAAGPRLDARATMTEAAARLLAAGGCAAVTTRAVAGAADTTAPTIFRIFGDKNGLMDALAEHVMAGCVVAKSARAGLQNNDPVQDVRNARHEHVDFGLAHPDLYVLLSTPGAPSARPRPSPAPGVSRRA